MTLLLAVAVLALVTLMTATVFVARAVVSWRFAPAPTVVAPAVVPFPLNRGVELERLLGDLTLAVDEGIRRVDRAEKRVAKTVTSARRHIREAGLEHPGLEAEYEELRTPDDNGIEPLPAVPEEVVETGGFRIPGGYLNLGGN